MKRFFSAVLTLCVCVLMSGGAYADAMIDMKIKNMEMQRKNCSNMMRKFGRGGDEQIRSDIIQYRTCYTFLEEYSPFSSDLVDEMTEIAYKYDTEKDVLLKQQYLLKFKDFVKLHLADIAVVNMALSLAHQNPEYGNPVLLRKVKNFLQEMIIVPGRPEANAPESSYYVVNYGEENYILSKIGGKLLKSEIYQITETYYNVHEIQDKETGQIKTIFVNVTAPIQTIKEREKLKEYMGQGALKL